KARRAGEHSGRATSGRKTLDRNHSAIGGTDHGQRCGSQPSVLGGPGISPSYVSAARSSRRYGATLFPEFEKLVSPHEDASLGEALEKKRTNSSERTASSRLSIRWPRSKRKLGIYDLARFTPKIGG